MTTPYNFYDTWYVKWLPPKYEEILERASSPVSYRSYRDIYYKFRRGFLIEGGTQKVWMNKNKLVLMVSAKTLDINGVLDSRYWQWVTNDSRFEQAAEAKEVEWFEVWQSIQSTLLSPQTRYNVSFVVKIDRNRMPTCPSPFTFSVKANEGAPIESAIYLDGFDRTVPNVPNKVSVKPDRGWTEFFVGEFNSTDSKTMEIEVSMKNTDRSFIKKGITIDGVKFTPID